MMAVSGGKILVIKNSRCPRWEYMFHDLKSPVCFACCLSRSQHPGETSETRKKLGLSAMLAFWRKEPFLFLFLTLLHLSSASWCLCLLLEILTVVILIPIFEKGLKFFKWFSQGEDENQGFSHSRALFFFNLCIVAVILKTHNHVEMGILVSIKTGYVLTYRRDLSAIWRLLHQVQVPVCGGPNIYRSTKYSAEHRFLSGKISRLGIRIFQFHCCFHYLLTYDLEQVTD